MEVGSLLRTGGEILLHLTLWYLTINRLLIPLTPVLLLVIIARSTEKIVYRKLYNAIPFSLEELPWKHDNNKNLPIINCFFLMKNNLNVSELRTLVYERMLDVRDDDGTTLYGRGTQRMVAGFFNFYWMEEKSFDIERHVYEKKTIYGSIDDVKREITTITSSPFEDAISPWEFVLLKYRSNTKEDDANSSDMVNNGSIIDDDIEGDDEVIKTAVIFRIHHSMADGGSLIYFLLNNLSDEKSLIIKPHRFTNLQKFYVFAMGYLNIPLLAIKQLVPYTPTHALHCTDASGIKQFEWSEPIPLPTVKAIKQKLGVTVNDVIVGCLATSFHDYFVDRDGGEVPNELMTAFPVDVRMDVKEALSFSNKFAILPIPLPTASSDVLVNIRKYREHMNKVKKTGEPITYHAGMRLFNYFLPNKVNDLIHHSFIKKTSMVLSNVPGPTEPVKFAGNELELICFWGAGKYDIGIVCSIFSYKEEVTVGFSWDKALHFEAGELLRRMAVVVNNLANTLEIPVRNEI